MSHSTEPEEAAPRPRRRLLSLGRRRALGVLLTLVFGPLALTYAGPGRRWWFRLALGACLALTAIFLGVLLTRLPSAAWSCSLQAVLMGAMALATLFLVDRGVRSNSPEGSEGPAPPPAAFWPDDASGLEELLAAVSVATVAAFDVAATGWEAVRCFTA